MTALCISIERQHVGKTAGRFLIEIYASTVYFLSFAMKLLTCPVNGTRPLSEFVFGGELREMPDPAVSDELWADYVFNRAGQPGVRPEWWYHVASGTWFIAERNTLRDEFVRTYLYGGNA